MANVKQYGQWLRERREEVRPKLTRIELARLAGMSHTHVSLLETGTASQEPRVNRIDDLSRALEQFLHRPLVNEARRVLGYGPNADEPEPGNEWTPRDGGALPPPEETDDLTLARTVQETGSRLPAELRKYIAEKWLKELASSRPRRPLNGKSEPHRSVSGLCTASL